MTDSIAEPKKARTRKARQYALLSAKSQTSFELIDTGANPRELSKKLRESAAVGNYLLVRVLDAFSQHKQTVPKVAREPFGIGPRSA